MPSFVATRLLDAERDGPPGVPEIEDARRKQVLAMARVAVAAGLDPRKVADLTVSAIRERRFVVLPHFEEACEAVEDRIAWMRTKASRPSLRGSAGRVRS